MVELEIDGLGSELGEGGLHPVFAVVAAVEQHVAAAAGAGDLATQGPLGAGDLVEPVDVVVADPRRHLLLRLPGAVQQGAELGQAVAQQGVLHRRRQLFLHPQPVGRARFLRPVAPHLVVDDVVGDAGRPGEAEQQVVLELGDRLRSDPQRVDDHLVGPELDEVETAEDRGVLVLGAAFEPEVLALDRVGEARPLVVGQGDAHVLGEQADQRHHDRRGGAEARARRRRAVQEEVEAVRRVGGQLLDRRLDQVELVAVGPGVVERDRGDDVEVEGLNPDLAVGPRPQRAVGVAVDRRAEHEAALLGGVGRHVRAAAGEADPQRRPGAQQALRALFGGMLHSFRTI